MSAVELGVNIGALIEVPPCVEEQELVRPALDLSPVDSVVQRLTVPGAFSPQEQTLVLKAHGLTEAKIAGKIQISTSMVNHEITKARSEYGSCIGAIISLESTGQIPRELLTEGLDFDKYLLLTHRQRDVLDSILEKDTWVISNTPQGIRRHLMNIYSTLGVQNRTQAVIYGLYLPEEVRRRSQELETKQPLKPSPIDSVMQEITIPGRFTRVEQVAVLKAHGLENQEIATRLGTSLIIKKDWEGAIEKYGTTIGAIMGMVAEGRIPQELLTIGLQYFIKYRFLTDNQKELLNLISQKDMWGMGDKEVAARLGISESAARDRLQLAMSKLKVRNRYQAIIYNLLIPEGMKTPDPLQVLALRAQGLEDADIAEKFNIAQITVSVRMGQAIRGFASTVDAALCFIERGQIDKNLLTQKLDFRAYDALTPDQKTVLAELVATRDVGANRVIAAHFGLTTGAVEAYLDKIYDKLRISNRVQAAVFEYLRPGGEYEQKRSRGEKICTDAESIRLFEQKALGLNNAQIAKKLKIKQDRVNRKVTNMRHEYGDLPDIHIIATLVEQGQISRAMLDRQYDLNRYDSLSAETKEIVDYLKHKENWGKALQKTAFELNMSVRKLQYRLGNSFKELGFAQEEDPLRVVRRLQLEVFSYLLTHERIPIVPLINSRRRRAFSVSHPAE